MKSFIPVLFLIIIFPPVTFGQDTSYVSNFYIGETILSVNTVRFGAGYQGITFINLHHNENTSVKAATEFLYERGGNLFYIDNCGERFVSFLHQGNTYLFDPNRIYSPAGIATTLQLLSCYDTTAAAEVENFAKQLLTNYIDSSRMIIALHNNTDKDLSVKSYRKDQLLKRHFGKVYINPMMDEDDFVFTTDTTIFNSIREKNINVVWENGDSTKDDGSLSIYAARHHIPYINVEAQHDHTDEQIMMLEALEEIIKEYESP